MLPEHRGILQELSADSWGQLYRCRWSAEQRCRILPLLQELLESPDALTQQAGLDFAGRIGVCNQLGALEPIVLPVIRLTFDSDPMTRSMAVAVLSIIGRDAPEPACKALIVHLDDPELTAPALRGIMSIGQPADAAVPHVIPLCGATEAKLRILAIRTLAAIGAKSPEVDRILKAASNDRSKVVRAAAEKARLLLGV